MFRGQKPPRGDVYGPMLSLVSTDGGQKCEVSNRAFGRMSPLTEFPAHLRPGGEQAGGESCRPRPQRGSGRALARRNGALPVAGMPVQTSARKEGPIFPSKGRGRPAS